MTLLIGDVMGQWIKSARGFATELHRFALAVHRFGIDWQAFADRFGLPGQPRHLSRYWRRRREWTARRANRKARRA